MPRWLRRYWVALAFVVVATFLFFEGIAGSSTGASPRAIGRDFGAGVGFLAAAAVIGVACWLFHRIFGNAR